MTSKRFICIQFLIIIILTFALVCNTFSWAQRPAVQGGGFMSINNTNGGTTLTNDKTYYTALSFVTPSNGYFLNGKGCTAKTYQGTLNATTGEITYGTTSITNLARKTYQSGTTLYFRTEITNGAAVVTNTSLFISILYSTALEGNYYVGVTTPTKDRITYAAEGTSGSYKTVKWIPVVAQYEIAASGNAYIDWYVDLKSTGSFQITNIVLTNN